MFWTIIALGMTVLMGGIIAYNGDVIGRKFGKKRLSMFGLRPKHTAILITSVTGVLISASTTAAIFLLTPPVRRVMLEGEQAIRELPKVQQQTKNLTAEKQSLQSEITLAKQERAANLKDLAATRQRVKNANDELRKVKREKLAADKSLKGAIAARESAEAMTAELRAVVEPLRKQARDLARGNVTLAEDNRRLSTLKSQLSARIEEQSKDLASKAEQNRQYDVANKELASQNERLVRENRDVQTQNERLAMEQKVLRRITQDLQVGAAELEEKNQRLLEDNSRLGELNTRLVTQSKQLAQDAVLRVGALYSTLEALRTRPIAVHTGEDLARITVPARSTATQVRDYLKQLTREASDSARSKGSDSGERASMLAVQIVDKRTLADTPFGVREVSITEEQQLNQVVNVVTESPVAVCVLAVAAGNSVKGEPAIIDLQPMADRLVYPRGRLVARSKKLNASLAPEIVFMDMVQFLKDVGRTAVERGMIPRVDPLTGEPQVGALDWPELVRLVERVRGHSRSVQVTAVAADDTSASGPLKLEFRVEGTL